MIYEDCPFCWENWDKDLQKEDGTYYCEHLESNITDCEKEKCIDD